MLVTSLLAPAPEATPAQLAATRAATVGPGAEMLGLAPSPDRLPACAAVVAAMAPRERLAQRLIVGVDGSDPLGTAEIVRRTQIGGVFVGGSDPELLAEQALRGVQAVSRVPLTVAVDDEGGRVTRIEPVGPDLPSARVMAAQLTPPAVRELGRERGVELIARGITMNLAPVADVGAQPDGAVIGDRSFGDDPGQVAAFAGAFALGQREAGVFTVLKHFPGHGRADGDSHLGRVSTPSLGELRTSDLEPYAVLLGPGGVLAPDDRTGRTGVMVGHLDVPGLTADLPSSLTPAVYTLLREDYGFDGLVMTDDLGAMKAVTGTFELPEAVERALAAGSDVALWSKGGPAAAGRVGPVLDRIDDALATGRLDTTANDTAVERVLSAKGVCSRR